MRNLTRAWNPTLATAALSVFLTIIYFMINQRFVGPAYLEDEIGYLLNGAALTGDVIDAANSYHFGYSLFLVPAFALFDDPSRIWRAVQLTNATLFGASFFTLYVISRQLVPNVSPFRSLIAVLICALYPAWLSISGYAFSQPAFVLVYLLSVLSLLRGCDDRASFLLLHGVFVGFLYWIHPTGAAVAIASILILALVTFHTRAWLHATLSAIATIGLIVVYQYFLQPTLWAWMTPVGHEPNLIYPEVSLSAITPFVIWQAFVRAMGQLAYLTIGTLGFALIGCLSAARYVFIGKSLKDRAIGAYLLLSLAGIIAMGALMFASAGVTRTDHWMYGRYLEGVILPLLVMGFLWPKTRLFAVAALLAPIAFMVLAWFTPGSIALGNSEYWWGANPINTSSFWPAILPQNATLGAGLLIGSVVATIALLLPRMISLALLAGLFCVSSYMQLAWHSHVTLAYTPPSSIPELIRDSWSPGTCIGVDPHIAMTSRDSKPVRPYEGKLANLFTFLLHNYRIQRMSFEDWASKCDGPYMTSDFLVASANSSLHAVARQDKSDFLVIAKRPLGPGAVVTSRNTFVEGDACTRIRNCYALSADDLSAMSQVGELRDGALHTDDRLGFLFFGPYRQLPPGAYRIVLDAEIADPTGSYVDITSGSRDMSILKKFDLSSGIKEFEFQTSEPLEQMQVRLFVSEKTIMEIKGYMLLDDQARQLSRP